jgi:hypothetical protein
MFPTRRQIKVQDYLGVYQPAMIEVPLVMPPEGVLIPVALKPKLPAVTYLNGTYGQNKPSWRFLLDGKAYDLTVASGQLANDNVEHQLIAPWLIKTYGGNIALTDMGGTISAEIIDAPPGSPANTGKTTFFVTSMVETWTHVGERDDVDAEFESQQLVIVSSAYAGAAGRIRDGIVDGVPGHGDGNPANGYVGEPVIGPACAGW